jgi:hypothetical protein
VADTITEVILGGVVGIPRNAPKKLIIEFEAGMSLAVEGDALRIWWLEQLNMYNLFMKLTSGPPPVPSETIQDIFEEREKKKTPEDH